MARPLSEEKRKKLLESALTLFVDQGVNQTSTNEITKHAGTAAGTLFLYFPSKQNLIQTLVLEISHQQSELIKSQLSPDQSPKEALLTVWNSTIDWFLDNLKAYHYIRQVRDSGIIDQETIQQTALFFDFYYTIVQSGLQTGEIKPYPVDLIGNFLYQDIVAIMDIIKYQSDPLLQKQYREIGFLIFWDGIKN